MFNQSRQDQAPFRQAGLVGLNQYMNMLGLGSGSGGSSGVQPYGGGFSAGGNDNPFVTVGSSGAPSVNAQLYGSDPAYKQAWDQAVAEHQGQWGKPYQADSSVDAVNNRVTQLYSQFGGGKTVGTAGYETGTPANLSPLGGGTPAPNAGQQQQDAFAMFRNTPGYQFGLDEGNRSVQASAAARGGLNSGATLKALQKFGNDYADQQGYTPYMNRLATLSGMAPTSAGVTAQLGQNYANQVGNNLQNAGQARAQGIYGSANAWSNFGQQASSAIGNYFGQRSGGFGPGTIGSGI